jgi:hypothetical protein
MFSYYFVDKQSIPFRVVSAFLRLGKKYDLKQLYREAFTRLHHDFPSKLEAWDANALYDRISFQAGLEFDTINLLREVDIPLFLPSAFVFVCQDVDFDVHEILGGIRRDDSSLALLSMEDSAILLRGRQTLMDRQAESTFIWLDDEAAGDIFPDCAQPPKCAAAREKIFYSLWHPLPLCIALADWDVRWEARLCKECIRQSKIKHHDGRQQIWKELPSIFGFPEWQQLPKE